MKRFLMTLSLMFCMAANAGPASPGSGTFIDTSKITPEQAAQIQKQVEEMQQKPTNVSASVRKEAEAWGELGANMGRAMIGAAKEVGVAANEFAGTSLGKITVAIVAYKIIGQDVLKIILGTATLIVGTWLAILGHRRYAWDFKYETKPILWGTFNRRYVVERTAHDETFAVMIISTLFLVFTWIVGLNIIL